ncbi:hypothetical protein [Planctomyces sp. SH-PL62]|uniref:hypothetical protein n=1 Tax=Planctomyces sp. SH-PL62 TaxID=1636152 RepID=UPI00078E6ED1|nr:hypothetical protein [Planctomyces sp. SH-PL62]AMV37446.1 hypothetical protein VT85_08425 [Planctomyces sp. SH-PL62]
MKARAPLSIGLLAVLLAAGCGQPEDSVDDRLAKLEALVPVSGVVKIGGKAVPGVVVTFIPEEWAPAHGETDEEGKFSLITAARPGAIPGDYKVVLSYLVAADGRVLGLEDRAGFVPDPAVATATEKLPPSITSFENTPLAATIPDGGTTTLDFEVDAQLDAPAPTPGPSPEPPAEPAKD